MIEHAGQSCAIGSALVERIHQPYHQEGQRTGALRFGDERATALAGALCTVLGAVTGFSNKSLRPLVAAHLDRPYSQSQMSYDLRRLAATCRPGVADKGRWADLCQEDHAQLGAVFAS